jgi:hypothetical protein
MKRVNLKKILSDPKMRKKLMVSVIRSVQAVGGIETTEKQAEEAYDLVRKSTEVQK